MKELNLIDVKKFVESKGATIAKNGKALNIKKGFVVSILGSETKIDMNNKYSWNYIKIALNNYLMNNNKKYNVGLWIDNGVAYVDYSVIVKDEKSAQKLAKENKQLAYFNAKENIAIYL